MRCICKPRPWSTSGGAPFWQTERDLAERRFFGEIKIFGVLPGNMVNMTIEFLLQVASVRSYNPHTKLNQIRGGAMPQTSLHDSTFFSAKFFSKLTLWSLEQIKIEFKKIKTVAAFREQKKWCMKRHPRPVCQLWRICKFVHDPQQVMGHVNVVSLQLARIALILHCKQSQAARAAKGRGTETYLRKSKNFWSLV